MARIIVVEDEPITAADLEEKLTALGHEVTWFDTGEEVAAEARSASFDLVLMDIRLRGEMNGIDAAEQLCQQGDVPIVFLTAFTDQPTVDRASATHPYGYLLKPFTDRSVAVAVQVALARAANDKKRLEGQRCSTTALQSVGEALIMVDESATIRFINAPAEAMLHVRANEILGRDARTWLRFAPELFGDSEHPLDIALRDHQLSSSRARTLLAAEGRTNLLVSYSATPAHSASGAKSGAVLVLREVAKGAVAPDSEHLVAMNELSRRLAHEINNPLTYNLYGLDLALSELDELRAASTLDAAENVAVTAQRQDRLLHVTQFLRDAREGASRIAGVVRELNLFSLSERDLAPLQPNELLELAVGLSKLDLAPDVQLVWQIAAAPIIQGNKWQLAGAIAYSIRNAVDALEPSEAHAVTAVLAVGTDARGWAALSITARGRLASEPTRTPHLGDPPRPTSVGRELAEQVVDRHGGELIILGRAEVRTVELRLPPMSLERERPAAEEAAQRGNVLLVNDEPMVGRTLAITLQPEHYVTAITSAQGALDLLMCSDVFDVILYEVSMPEMDSQQFYEQLHAARPGIADSVIFLTQRLKPEQRDDRFLERTATRRLEQPFSAEQLMSLVAEGVRVSTERRAHAAP